MKYRCSSWIYIVSVVFLLASPGWSTTATLGPPSIEYIQAAMEQQNNASIECVYSFEAHNRPGGEPGTVVKDKELWTYIRTPEFFYLKDSTPQEHFSERSGMTGIVGLYKKQVAADGVIWGRVVRHQPTINGSWTAWNRPDTIMFPLTPKEGDPFAASLYGWLRYGKVSSTMESIDGHDCWRVDMTRERSAPNTPERIQAWLDPTMGFCPRLIKVSGTNSGYGDYSDIAYFKEYRQIKEGIWFPAYVETASNDPKNNLKDLRNIWKAEVLRADRMYSKNEIQPQFPPEAKVFVLLADGKLSPLK